MDAMPVTTVEAGNRTPLMGSKCNDEEEAFSQLGHIGGEVQKLLDQRLASLVVKASSGVHIGPSYHFHPKEGSNKGKNPESLGGKSCNEQTEMGQDRNSSVEEYEYVPYMPTAQRNDSLPIQHTSDTVQEFQKLSLDPKVSETNNSTFSYQSNDSNVFNPIPLASHSNSLDVNSLLPISYPSIPIPLFDQTEASEKAPNVFFPRSEDIFNTQVLLDHRYEVIDGKKLQYISKDRYEVIDGKEVQNITNERQEVEELRLHEKINAKLEPWPKKFVENKGFRLGIIPGSFYKSLMGVFVELSNGTKYQILLGNDNAFSCDVDVYVDNIIVIRLRLRPGKSTILDGPKYSKKGFVFLKTESAPTSAGIQPKCEHNGIIRAVFLPEKVERTRAMSEPISYSRNISNVLDVLGINQKNKQIRANTCATPRRGSYERSFDVRQFCEGATALQGEQTPKYYEKVEEMEVNTEEQVELLLRLISRTDDLNVPCPEEISSLRPPPIWSLN